MADAAEAPACLMCWQSGANKIGAVSKGEIGRTNCPKQSCGTGKEKPVSTSSHGLSIIEKRSILGGMNMELTAVFLRFPEGYAAFVEELPGANTQGATLEEARANLLEAARMVVEANRELAEEELGGLETGWQN